MIEEIESDEDLEFCSVVVGASLVSAYNFQSHKVPYRAPGAHDAANWGLCA